MIEKYFSGSYDGTEIQLDYREYENYVYFESEVIMSNLDCSITALTSLRDYASKASNISTSLEYYKKLDSLGCIGHLFQGDEEGWMQTFYLPFDIYSIP